MRGVHWGVTVFYRQIESGNRTNQIHGFTIDYGNPPTIMNCKYIKQAQERKLVEDPTYYDIFTVFWFATETWSKFLDATAEIKIQSTEYFEEIRYDDTGILFVA